MKRSVSLGVTIVAIGTALAVRPALSQTAGFRIIQPTQSPVPRAESGSFTVRWADPSAVTIDTGSLTAITWYYASQPDGSDRVRMVTQFREDFSEGFRHNWRAEGPFDYDWIVRKEPGRRFLSGRGDATPVISLDAPERDTVISALVRPRGHRNEFALGLRIQANGRGFEVRNSNNKIQLIQAGRVLSDLPSLEVSPRNWYWYEVGLRTRKTEVECRVRVLDEKRSRVVCSLPVQMRPRDDRLLERGLIALTGPADFAEIYVDSWASRWMDDTRNEFHWNTSRVPDGSYWIIAELTDGRGRPRLEMSSFQVEVRNPAQAALDE